MTYKYYLLTIKTRGKVYTTPLELYNLYDKVKETMRLTEWSDLRVLEKTKCNRLHFHTIVITQENIFRLLKMRNNPRVYMHFQEFPPLDYSNVRNYLLKQVKDRDQQNEIIMENFFEHENAFFYVDRDLMEYPRYLCEQYNRHPIY